MSGCWCESFRGNDRRPRLPSRTGILRHSCLSLMYRPETCTHLPAGFTKVLKLTQALTSRTAPEGRWILAQVVSPGNKDDCPASPGRGERGLRNGLSKQSVCRPFGAVVVAYPI